MYVIFCLSGFTSVSKVMILVHSTCSFSGFLRINIENTYSCCEFSEICVGFLGLIYFHWKILGFFLLVFMFFPDVIISSLSLVT